MKAVIILALVAAVSAIAPLRENEYQFLFTRFVAEHNKAYSTSEFFHRFSIFKANVDYIRAENNKNHTYTLGMTQFGDLTAHEFKTDIVGQGIKGGQHGKPNPEYIPSGRAPPVIDWNAKGKVQKVKNQAQCGSCWAFSATASLESAFAIKNEGKDVPDLSEQQLVDCAGSYGNEGCNGGLMSQAFDYYIKGFNGVANSGNKYKYTGRDGSCKADKSDVAVTIASYDSLPPGNEGSLGDYLSNGPISVAIEADQAIFQFYTSGVLDGACGRNLDHGVTLVGFGDDGKGGYWIVKNSWGTSWGNKGYVWIRQGKNMCGIAVNYNVQPKV
jgi:C1A family cysteine protease